MTLSPIRMSAGILAIFLILSGCRALDKVEITGVDQLRLQNIRENTVSFAANVGISNRSAIGFKVREINVKVSADGSYLGILTAADTLKVRPRSDSIYSMTFNLELANLMNSISAIYRITRQDSVHVAMQGYVKSRSHCVTKKIEFAETRFFKVPEFATF